MERLINKMITPLARRVGNMLARGVVTGVEVDGNQQVLQLRLLAGEARDRVEHFEPFGFTSHPKAGAEHLTAFLDGDRNHGIVLVVNDRRYRLSGLPEGGVALYDAHGSSIALNADGTITQTAAVIYVTGELHVAQNIVSGGDVIAAGNVADQGGAHSLKQVRDAHNGHHGHSYPGSLPDVSA